MKKVSIIIPTYNRINYLQKTLHCLINQDYPLALHEIIIIDDASSDNTAIYLEKISKQKSNIKYIVHKKNYGPSKTRNDGLKIAQGEIIILLDDDMEVEKNFISQHVDFLENNPKTIQLVKIIMPPEIQNQPFVKYLSKKGLYHLKEGIDLPWKDFTSGNISMKKKYIDLYGGFSEDFTSINWEDQELGLRLIESGLRLRYNPKIKIIHYYYPSLKKYCHKMEMAAKNALILYQKHPHDYIANFFRLNYLKPVLSRDHNSCQKIKNMAIRLIFNQSGATLINFSIRLIEPLNFHSLLYWLYGYLIGYHHLKGIKQALGGMKINKTNSLYKFVQ